MFQQASNKKMKHKEIDTDAFDLKRIKRLVQAFYVLTFFIDIVIHLTVAILNDTGLMKLS